MKLYLVHTHGQAHRCCILNSRCEGVLVIVDGASFLWTIDVICQVLKKYVICDYKKTEVKAFLKLICIRTILCADICEYDVCVCSSSQLWLLGETLNV